MITIKKGARPNEKSNCFLWVIDVLKIINFVLWRFQCLFNKKHIAAHATNFVTYGLYIEKNSRFLFLSPIFTARQHSLLCRALY